MVQERQRTDLADFPTSAIALQTLGNPLLSMQWGISLEEHEVGKLLPLPKCKDHKIYILFLKHRLLLHASSTPTLASGSGLMGLNLKPDLLGVMVESVLHCLRSDITLAM